MPRIGSRGASSTAPSMDGGTGAFIGAWRSGGREFYRTPSSRSRSRLGRRNAPLVFGADVPHVVCLVSPVPSRPVMARSDRIPVDAPTLPPLTAMRTLRKVARFVRPYRRELVYAAIALVVAAGAVLTIGQGLKFVIDRGFGSGGAEELDRSLGLMLGVVVVMATATYTRFYFVSWL